MKIESYNRATDLQAKIKCLRIDTGMLDKVDESSNVHAIHAAICGTGITERPSLRHLTFAYLCKCRELLKLDLEAAEREFANL